MGKRGQSMINDSLIIDKISERNQSMINDWERLDIDSRIDRAMKELGIAKEWRRAVARGACHLSCARFATLVAETKVRAKTSKPRYFIRSLSREISLYK